MCRKRNYFVLKCRQYIVVFAQYDRNTASHMPEIQAYVMLLYGP